MEKNWTKIFSSTNPIEVEILKQMLKENGVISIDINQQDSSYNMFGNINLYVQEEYVEHANKLMTKNNNERNS
ncbi:MAG: hypothetical protein CMD22_03520 [Flavobacteriales bacterium]|nr:hypothetical protein [Flavobacteriales bacterium]|tara:strand:- start:49688 stop:49906 length:219 start_codon:yes stop_codon:yes gene_type:complete